VGLGLRNHHRCDNFRTVLSGSATGHMWNGGQDEIFLSGMLAEFRTALRQEIEATRRHEASSAVPLINGRRIAQIGGGYQYVFDAENLLDLPACSPMRPGQGLACLASESGWLFSADECKSKALPDMKPPSRS